MVWLHTVGQVQELAVLCYCMPAVPFGTGTGLEGSVSTMQVQTSLLAPARGCWCQLCPAPMVPHGRAMSALT